MEELEITTESKVEVIKGREYDVETIKRPRYTEEESNILKNSLLGEISTKQEQRRALELEIEVLTKKYNSI